MMPLFLPNARGLATLVVLTLAGTTAFAFAEQAEQGAINSAQSAAFFLQMAPVLQSPRCMNCHPADAHPTQGDDLHQHMMNVSRGPEDHGAPGLHCSTCHQAGNQPASGAPGAPDWHLAPLRMAWQGKTPGQICRTILNPAQGGMKPDQLVAHFSDDDFVRWAWAPGTDSHGMTRTAPPIPHDQFVALARQWVAAGAACPK